MILVPIPSHQPRRSETSGSEGESDLLRRDGGGRERLERGGERRREEERGGERRGCQHCCRFSTTESVLPSAEQFPGASSVRLAAGGRGACARAKWRFEARTATIGSGGLGDLGIYAPRLARTSERASPRLSPFATPITWRTAQSQWEHGKSEQVEHWEHGHHDLWPLLMKEHSQG